MTQMMLFDSVAENVTVVPVPAIDRVAVTEQPVVTTPALSTPAADRVAGKPAVREGGLNHMGDLARLVLLRYELAAKRRAEAGRRSETARRAR